MVSSRTGGACVLVDRGLDETPQCSPCETLASGKFGVDSDGRVCGISPGKVHGERAQLTSSVAVRRAAEHYAVVQNSLKRRSPTDLGAALKEACGERFLRTVACIRRSKHDPVKRRTACEVLLASQLVRARSTLTDWQRALRDISDALFKKDRAVVTALLQKWNFAPDEKQIRLATEDLQRWSDLEETHLPRLVQAAAGQDFLCLSASLKELNRDGPIDGEETTEARQLFLRFAGQEQHIQAAIASRSRKQLVQAIRAWEFEPTNKDFETAKVVLADVERQIAEEKTKTRLAELAAIEWKRVADARAAFFRQTTPAEVESVAFAEEEANANSVVECAQALNFFWAPPLDAEAVPSLIHTSVADQASLAEPSMSTEIHLALECVSDAVAPQISAPESDVPRTLSSSPDSVGYFLDGLIGNLDYDCPSAALSLFSEGCPKYTCPDLPVSMSSEGSEEEITDLGDDVTAEVKETAEELVGQYVEELFANLSV